METKILITSPYREMTDVISEISEKVNIPLICIEGTMSEAARMVKKTIEQNSAIEVVISRAGTYEEIANQNINLPLIRCENSDFDILEAFWKAKGMGGKIGFLAYQDNQFPYKLKKLCEIIPKW